MTETQTLDNKLNEITRRAGYVTVETHGIGGVTWRISGTHSEMFGATLTEAADKFLAGLDECDDGEGVRG